MLQNLAHMQNVIPQKWILFVWSLVSRCLVPHDTQLLSFYRWRNWWIRGMFSLVMFAGFLVVVYFGPLALILLVCS